MLPSGSGPQHWRFKTGPGYGVFKSPPAVVDGVVYVGSDDGCVYAITEE